MLAHIPSDNLRKTGGSPTKVSFAESSNPSSLLVNKGQTIGSKDQERQNSEQNLSPPINPNIGNGHSLPSLLSREDRTVQLPFASPMQSADQEGNTNEGHVRRTDESLRPLSSDGKSPKAAKPKNKPLALRRLLDFNKKGLKEESA